MFSVIIKKINLSISDFVFLLLNVNNKSTKRQTEITNDTIQQTVSILPEKSRMSLIENETERVWRKTHDPSKAKILI